MLKLESMLSGNRTWKRVLNFLGPGRYNRSFTLIILIHTLIARFMGSTWGPSGADRTQVVPMLAPGTLLSGHLGDWYDGRSTWKCLQGSDSRPHWSQYCFKVWPGAIGHQAITWTSFIMPYYVTRPRSLGLSKMADILHMFKCVSLKQNSCVLILISQNVVSVGPIDNRPLVIQVIAKGLVWYKMPSYQYREISWSYFVHYLSELWLYSLTYIDSKHFNFIIFANVLKQLCRAFYQIIVWTRIPATYNLIKPL